MLWSYCILSLYRAASHLKIDQWVKSRICTVIVFNGYPPRATWPLWARHAWLRIAIIQCLLFVMMDMFYTRLYCRFIMVGIMTTLYKVAFKRRIIMLLSSKQMKNLKEYLNEIL